jgi:glycosyltransferase involved in cell wall biosynthesis
MRILMLAQSFAPTVGGEERVVEDLSLALTRRGHEVSIATLRQPGGGPASRIDGMRIHALRSSSYRVSWGQSDPERRHAPPAPDPETVLNLRRVLHEERPEVVHAHNWLVHSYLPLDHPRGASLLLSLHDYGLLCATKRLFYEGALCSGPGPLKCMRCAGEHYKSAKGVVTAVGTLAFQRHLRRHVDIFLPVSSAVEDLCQLRSGDVSRVIPNFIDELPGPPAADDPRLSLLPEEPFVLYFGDVTEDKGAWNLAEVYRSLERPPPLVLIGRCYLNEIVGRPGVHVLGAWPHELAIAALRRSLFTVAPSIWPEPFGLVALETAAAGKPILASKIGGLPDIVAHEETGLLVAPGDRSALRDALQRLIADPELRSRLGEGAARRARIFSPEAVVPQFEAAYEDAIEARRPQVQSAAR